MRRSVSLLIAAASGAVLCLAGAAPANAAGGCTVSAALPEEVAFTKAVVDVQATLLDPGGCVGWATYDVVRADGKHVGSDVFEGAGWKPEPLSAKTDGPGSYRLVGRVGESADGGPLTLIDSAPVVAKLGSRVTWAKATRSKGKLTVKATATRFDGVRSFKGWSTTVQLQRWASGAGWVTVSTRKASSKGAVTVTTTQPRGDFRVAVSETATTWDAASGLHDK